MVATETHFVLSGLLLVLSASAFGGLRWSLSQLLLRNKKMGLDNPAATIFWLSPAMGLTLAIISMSVDNWVKVFQSSFFHGVWTTFITSLYLLAPGVVAFCMLMSEFQYVSAHCRCGDVLISLWVLFCSLSIVQRAGVVPMSIAGIAKEVATITISAWFFGDELTPLNITGVAISTCGARVFLPIICAAQVCSPSNPGIALFTYHKYRKSIESTVPLDAHGNPIAPEDIDECDDPSAYVELDQTDDMNSSMLRAESEAVSQILFDLNSKLCKYSFENRNVQDMESTDGNRRLLFCAEDEGEEDAEEFRSIRSSKIRWDYRGQGSAVTEGRDDSLVDQSLPEERIEGTH